MQDILTDASSKIQRFKESLEARRGEANAAAQVEKLQEKHDRERKEALGEFKSFQRTVKERERQLGAEFRGRLDEMSRDLDSERQRFAASLT
eukprot:623-Heterococcus_DN1.PRE.1